MRRHDSAGLRGGLISLLISIQLLTLDILTRAAITQMLRELATPPSIWSQGLHVALDVLLLVSLWLYYDSIDDRGFAQFCASRNQRPLWDTPAHESALFVAIFTAAPILAFPLYDLLIIGGALPMAAALIAPAVSLATTVGGRMWILARLRSIWEIQSQLRTGKEKIYGHIHRILYAAIFFLSLALALWVGISMFAPQLIRLGGLIPKLPAWLVGVVLTALLTEWSVHMTVLTLHRRRFLSRLQELSERKRITFSVEGHPYLTLLFPFLYTGLTVVHHEKEGNLDRQTVYCVGMISGKRKRSVLILCQNQVYRLMHRLPGQVLFYRASTYGRAFYKPLYVWFESHAFDFPAGAGQRILLIFPFPAVVGMPDGTEDWFSELDNGALAFGYTVYDPNTFLHTLERM